LGGGPQTVDDAFSSPIERLHSRRALRAASTLIDACRQVRDPASGGLYYWNTSTDETTAVGAPRPTGPTALAVEDSRGLMRADAPSTTSLSRGLAVTEGMIRSLATEQARMCELSPRRSLAWRETRPSVPASPRVLGVRPRPASPAPLSPRGPDVSPPTTPSTGALLDFTVKLTTVGAGRAKRAERPGSLPLLSARGGHRNSHVRGARTPRNDALYLPRTVPSHLEARHTAAAARSADRPLGSPHAPAPAPPARAPVSRGSVGERVRRRPHPLLPARGSSPPASPRLPTPPHEVAPLLAQRRASLAASLLVCP